MPGPGDDVLILPTGRIKGHASAIMSKTITAGDDILIFTARDGKKYGYKPAQIFPGDSLLVCPVKGDKRQVVGLTDYPDFMGNATWTSWSTNAGWAPVTTTANGCTCYCAVYGPERYHSGATISIPIRAYCNRQMFTYYVQSSQWTAGNPPQLMGYGVGSSSVTGALNGDQMGASGTWYGYTEYQKGSTLQISFQMTAECGGSITPGEKVPMVISNVYVWRA